jgi:hypothetical protein
LARAAAAALLLAGPLAVCGAGDAATLGRQGARQWHSTLLLLLLLPMRVWDAMPAGDGARARIAPIRPH